MKDYIVNTLIQNILFGKQWWLFRHLFFWIFIYLDETLSLLGITEQYEEYYTIAISFALDVLVVYINIYILYPLFLKKRRFAEYIGLTLVSLVLLVLSEHFIEVLYFNEEDLSLSFYINVFVQTAVTLSTAVAIKVLKTVFEEKSLREQIEKEKLTFELQNLKKQINPHFLFNILNGMYIQSQVLPEEVPDMIMQFSDLLRYQIYDAEKNEQVLLTKEIEFIENYIALEQFRRDNTEIQFKHEVESKSFKIEPLIFLTLVENAFKYSIVGSNAKSVILLSMIQRGNELLFSISNTIGSISFNEDEEGAGGFGLDNLRKRLSLLYPNNHKLEIEESKDGIFSVKLEITTS